MSYPTEHTRTWNDPLWGTSKFFVSPPRIDFKIYFYKKRSWYIFLGILCIISTILKIIIKEKTNFTIFYNNIDLYLIAVLTLVFVIFTLLQAYSEHYSFQKRQYLEIMEQGFYFWEYGYINGAHPFFPYNQITSAIAHLKGGSCWLNLTFSSHQGEIILAIPKSDIRKILELAVFKDSPENKLAVTLKSCLPRI